MADRIQDLGVFTAYGEAREAGYEGTKAEFEEGLKKAAEAYDEAEAAAAAAAQSAVAAAASAVDASTAAAEADSSADAAQASEAAADVSAGAAASSAIDAGESADAASAAQTGAETAQVAAELAQTAAEAAATAADGSKTAAAGSATAAAGSATSASSSATSASGSATAAAGSATAASGSASDAAASATAAAGSAADSADSATAAAASAAQAASLGINKADVIVCSASGSIASFFDGADDMPVKELNIAIEPVQAGSGDPSPDNVRPISGWTGAKVTRTGKNLYDNVQYPFEQYSLYNPPVCWTAPIFLKRGTYAFSCSSGFGMCYISVYNTYEDASANTNRIEQYNFLNGEFITRTFVDDVYVRYQQNDTGGTSTDYEKVSQSWQTELGSTATVYEPYQGETYDITFPSEAGTVYGGTLDATSGTLTVDRAMVDLGTLRWNYNETYAFFVSSSLGTRKSGILNILSDLFKTQPGAWSGTPLTNAIWGDGSDTTIYVQYPITEVSEFLSLISGHQLMYELATPITYQLAPQEVTTLIGTNNIWADTGDVSVAYKADTKLYIDKKFAELQALILEN